MNKKDPLVALEEAQQKLADYFREHPDEHEIPEALARELVECTREYVEYQRKRGQPIT